MHTVVHCLYFNSTLLYPVSLLIGWSIQRANGKYKDHLVGQLTSSATDYHILQQTTTTSWFKCFFFLKATSETLEAPLLLKHCFAVLMIEKNEWISKKHCKNRECCPVSNFIARSLWNGRSPSRSFIRGRSVDFYTPFVEPDRQIVLIIMTISVEIAYKKKQSNNGFKTFISQDFQPI